MVQQHAVNVKDVGSSPIMPAGLGFIYLNLQDKENISRKGPLNS